MIDDKRGARRIALELVYQTVIDCHKIARKQSHYFKRAVNGDYRRRFKEKTLRKARQEVETWLNSDPFYFYAYALGFCPEQAIEHCYAILNGERKAVIAANELLETMPNQRAAYFAMIRSQQRELYDNAG